MLNLFTWIMAAAVSLVAPATLVIAEDKPVLTIYTYESFTSDWGPGPAIETAFEETATAIFSLCLSTVRSEFWGVSSLKARNPRQISFLGSTPT